MDNISNFLSSPQWWVSVVIAGILINIISGYLKVFIDKGMSSVSELWQNRSSRKAKETEEYIAKLQSSEKLFVFNSTKHVSLLGYAIVWMLLGSAAFMMSVLVRENTVDWFIALLACLGFFQGVLTLFKSNYYYSCAEKSVSVESS